MTGGVEHAPTTDLSIALTYRRSGYDDASFSDSVRPIGLNLSAASGSGDVSLRWRF